MEYLLMNKDNIVAKFQAKDRHTDAELGYLFQIYGHFEYRVENSRIEKPELLPYGFEFGKKHKNIDFAIKEWLENRVGANHNHTVEHLMTSQKLTGLEVFLHNTHATSLNDTFWVKSADEDTAWNDVSLYRKDFSEAVSKYCLGFDADLTGADFSSAPELVTNGSFRRGFEKRKDGIYINKRSSTHGYESYSEVFASEILKCFAPAFYTKYELIDKYDTALSSCKFFTDEKTGLVTYYHIADTLLEEDEILKYMSDHGYEDEFRRMAVYDSLIFNTDRHLNNFGFLMDNDTLEVKGFAPFFDMNLSLFPDIDTMSDADFSNHISGFHPRFGKDFTALGQRMMTDDIRADVEKMLDFHFDLNAFPYKGDEKFFNVKTEFIEKVLHKQAKALLSSESIKTKDVFHYQKSDEEIREEALSVAKFRCDTFVKILKKQLEDTPYRDYIFTVEKSDAAVKVTIEDEEKSGEAEIDFLAKSICYDRKQLPEAVTDLIYERLYVWFNT